MVIKRMLKFDLRAALHVAHVPWLDLRVSKEYFEFALKTDHQLGY